MYRICFNFIHFSSNVIRQKNLETSFIKRWAGHSKWQNIKHIKAVSDAAKSAYISRLNRRIPTLVREGGSIDPEKNSKLKAAFNEAKANNISKESIDKIIKRLAAGGDGKVTYLSVRGPRNLQFLLEIETNTINKTRIDITSIAKKFNFQVEMVRDNSPEFKEKGIIKCKPMGDGKNALDKAFEHAIDVNAEEVTEDEDKNLLFECSSLKVDEVRGKLEEIGYSVHFADSVIEFADQVELSDAEISVCEKFVGKLNQFPEIVKISDNIV